MTFTVEGKGQPKPSKDHPDVLIYNRKVGEKTKKWLEAACAVLDHYNYSKIVFTYYAVGLVGTTAQTDVPILVAHPRYNDLPTNVEFEGKLYPIRMMKYGYPYGMDPAQKVASMPFTDNATAMSLKPSATGFVKVWAHKDSIFANGGLIKHPTDGLNRAALKGLMDWKVLSSYIDTRMKTGLPIPRNAICDIVKTINITLAEQELAESAEMLQMEG